MRELAERPSTFWPHEERFHSRNRLKVERAMAQAQAQAAVHANEYVKRLVDIIQQRERQRTRNLLAMSSGGAGSHYLGELLNEFPGFQTTDEIYFPPAYLEEVDRSNDPDAWMALEFIDLLHTGRTDDDLVNATVVNIGHFRSDARPATLRELGYRPMFLLLLRNPFDVALGRAFRKEAYRSEVDPTASDDEYLEKQASYTANFLRRTRQERWDFVLRYERLLNSPVAVLRDLAHTLGQDWSPQQVERALDKYDPNRGPQGSQSTNLNTKPRQPVEPRHAEILHRALDDVAHTLGYAPPDRVMASAQPANGHAILLPLYSEESQYNEERFEALQSRKIKVIRSQPETAFVDDPTWQADPVGSRTWRLYYHSLAWLLALTWGADHNSDPSEILSEIKALVFSYLEANVFSPAADEMAWDDHAAADRLSVLAHLAKHYLDPVLTGEQTETLRTGIEVHIQRITSFYESKKWIASNHGLFHAVALLNAGIVLSGSREGDRASQAGKEYLFAVVEAMVDPREGVSLEQSFAYHSINLIILRRIALFLKRNSIDGNERLSEIAGLMVEFNLAIRGTGNKLLAIGDTLFGSTIPESALRPATGEVTTERVAHILSAGSEGQPFPDLLLYRSVGWAVFRSGEVYRGHEPVTRAVFTFSSTRGPHGHFDALSFAVQFRGNDLLVDSGGPYSYGDPLRFEYFVAPRAHNTILIDDRDHQGGARLMSSGDLDGATYVVAQHDGYALASLTRAVIHLSDATFAVVDASSRLSTPSKFTTLWHLSPRASTEDLPRTAGRGLSIRLDDAIGSLRMWSDGPYDVSVRVGSPDWSPVGWVTSAIDTKKAAPTVLVETHTKQLFSVTTISADNSEIEVETESTSCRMLDATGRDITVVWNGDTLDVAST